MTAAADGAREWKVTELAEAVGVPARTLHFYDEIGLLAPSGVTPSGARRYTGSDLERLRRIVELREQGHPVKRIPALLAEDGR